MDDAAPDFVTQSAAALHAIKAILPSSEPMD
jgi:hypothetical protein